MYNFSNIMQPYTQWIAKWVVVIMIGGIGLEMSVVTNVNTFTTTTFNAGGTIRMFHKSVQKKFIFDNWTQY